MGETTGNERALGRAGAVFASEAGAELARELALVAEGLLAAADTLRASALGRTSVDAVSVDADERADAGAGAGAGAGAEASNGALETALDSPGPSGAECARPQDETERRERATELVRCAEAFAVAVADARASWLVPGDGFDPDRASGRSAGFDLRALVEDVTAGHTALARARGLDLLVFHAPEVPDHVIGDPELLRRAVELLLDVALTRTRAGHVLLRVECEEREVSDALVSISIDDCGPRLEAAELEQLLSPAGGGACVSRSVLRAVRGARRAVEGMGGLLGASPGPRGTSFRLRVLLEIDREPRVVPLESAPLAGARVLFADAGDGAPLAGALAVRGASVELVDDAQALRALAEGARGAVLALVDGAHPEAAALGELLRGRAIPAILLEEDAFAVALRGSEPELPGEPDPGEARAALRRLFRGVLTRPVRPDVCAEALAVLRVPLPLSGPPFTARTLLESRRAAVAFSVKSRRRAGARVLIVDPSAGRRESASWLLERLACRVAGAASLAAAHELVESERFDLALVYEDLLARAAPAELVELRAASGAQKPGARAVAWIALGSLRRELGLGAPLADDAVRTPLGIADTQELLSRWYRARGESSGADEVLDSARWAHAAPPSAEVAACVRETLRGIDYLRRAADVGDPAALSWVAGILGDRAERLGAPVLGEITRRIREESQREVCEASRRLVLEFEQELGRVRQALELRARGDST